MRKKLAVFVLLALYSRICIAQQICPVDTAYPFTVDSMHFRIWNKSEYVPFFIKGCNLSVALPGNYPGQLKVSRDYYANWLSLLKEAGFNSIRLYTLHFPDFYEVLDSFNLANPKNPLFIFQGVWLEESLPGYNNDLRFLDSSFSREIMDNIDCIHGNATIPARMGKAFGIYSADVSKWNIGYIIGREVSGAEVLKTNQTHAADTVFTGPHFSITGSPSEVFMTSHLEEVVNYEQTAYQTQRPVCFSSWPTLDPLSHPHEADRMEDTASIDMNKIDFHLAPAGCFASYHAYPYYPDFISNDSLYQNYSDVYGPNSYIGYLTALKNHFNRMPLIVAETGVPSSWGIAHYSSSGMNHGGMSELSQGETILRIFHNAEDAGCGGAMNFALIDEWFKRTWITDPIDYNINRRILWHNVMGAEQNFGLLGFRNPVSMQNWASFNSSEPIGEIKASADYEFFHIGLSLNDTMQIPDDIWISLDTYRSDLGESILPNGDTVQNRAEFAIHITNYAAQLFVTEAYDIFRIVSDNSSPAQLYHSISTDGAPWVIERWENNDSLHQIQYVGDLKVNNNFQPESSTDAVTFFPDSVHIRLPWSLLHFVDPSRMTVFNDYRATPLPEDTLSDGIQISVKFHDQIAVPASRFTWNTWDSIAHIGEYKKKSFDVVKNGLSQFNNYAIAIGDSYSPVDSFPFLVDSDNGVLSNDFDMDGTGLQALIIGNASHGFVNLSADGSFSYLPNAGYVGIDYFEYCIFDGVSLSKTANVCLDVNAINRIQNVAQSNNNIQVFPNPANDFLYVKSDKPVSEVSIFSDDGKLMQLQNVCGSYISIDVTGLQSGNYFLKFSYNYKSALSRITIIR